MFPTRIVEIILLLFCASVIGVAGSITCGTKTCADFEYCSPFDNTCQSCENVCDVQHHNYDANRCDKDCQSKYLLNYFTINILLFLTITKYLLKLTNANKNKTFLFIF